MCVFCETVNPLHCDKCGRGPVCFDLPVNHRFRAIALPDEVVVCTGCLDMHEIERQIEAHTSLATRLEDRLVGDQKKQFREMNQRILAKLEAIRTGRPGETGDSVVETT